MFEIFLSIAFCPVPCPNSRLATDVPIGEKRDTNRLETKLAASYLLRQQVKFLSSPL